MALKLDLSNVPTLRGVLASYDHGISTTQDINNGFPGNVFPDGTKYILVRSVSGTVDIRHKGTTRLLATLSVADDIAIIRVAGQRTMTSIELVSNITGDADVFALE